MIQDSDFEGPPIHWSVISIIGAVVTATTLIVSLEAFADKLYPDPTNPIETSAIASPSKNK